MTQLTFASVLLPSLTLALLGGCSASSGDEAQPSSTSGGSATTVLGGAAGAGLGTSGAAQGGTQGLSGATGVIWVGGNAGLGGATQGPGGSLGAGGLPGQGGVSAGLGGAVANGGALGQGGLVGQGGSPGLGGEASLGGALGLGGNASEGGAVGVGGQVGEGGAIGAGGETVGVGGDMGQGGSTAAGGTTAAAGAGGAVSTDWHGCKAAISDETIAAEYTTWRSRYVVDCGDGVRARVQTGGANSPSEETFSEAIGYGMLLAVAMDDQATFDKLWAYYLSNLDANGLMNWKMQACTTTIWGPNGASDGDLDTAMALVQAEARWGGYAADANTLLDAIRVHETEQCTTYLVLLPGDAWGDCSGNNLNPSYFSPAYYRAFAAFQPEQAAFWTRLADDSITLLLLYQTQVQDALMSEWANASGTVADQSYGYNACRTPWRVGLDYAWWGTEGAAEYLRKVSTYVDAQGGVASTPFDKNSAYLGAFAMSGLVVDKCEEYYQSWMVGAIYDDMYFQGTLRVLAMLSLSGRLWYAY